MTLASLVHLASFSIDVLPAVECLVASGVNLRGPLKRPFNSLRELALDLSAPYLVQKIILPSFTPNLRVLAIQDRVPSTTLRAYDLFDDTLLARLDLGRVTFGHVPIHSTSRLDSLQHSTPVLVCLDRAAVGCIIPDNFRPPYLQLHSIRSNFEHSALTLYHIRACIRKGAAKKALFLPQELHPSMAILSSSSLSRARDDLLDAIDDAGVEYVGWYHADEETDASISETFRRYLDRERLEGRM
ncbi:hypothetical protein JCM10021v2_002488 [Rhodotorula toruloides]